MRPAPVRRAHAAFTLVEMLVVIAIVTILGGLILTALSSARKHSMIKRQQAQIDLLEKSYIERYATDFSEYPGSDGDDVGIAGNEALVRALLTTEKDGPYINRRDFTMKDTNNNDRMEILDVWNKPIRYLHHRDYQREPPNKNTFRIWSLGPDGLDQPLEYDSDDIRNWTPGQEDDE